MSYEFSSDQPLVSCARGTAATAIFGADHRGALRRRQWRAAPSPRLRGPSTRAQEGRGEGASPQGRTRGRLVCLSAKLRLVERPLTRNLREEHKFRPLHSPSKTGVNALILLSYKLRRPRCTAAAPQQGQRGKRVTIAAMSLRRMVAIEFGMCRSGRKGGSSGSVTVGYGKLREQSGGYGARMGGHLPPSSA